MILRPPTYTPTVTLLPYTTFFRSQAGGALQVSEQGRAKEGVGAEAGGVAVAGEEDAAHVRGPHAVGQARGEEGAAADADVAVEVGEVQDGERFVQRA